MKHGDLGVERLPRLIVVFEGLLGSLPDRTAVELERMAIRLHRWRAAAEQWELVPRTVTQIWHLYWHLDFRIDIVTFKGKKFGRALAERLTEDDVPHGQVLSDQSAYRFARQMAYMPDVAAVFDPDPEHQFVYGPKGRIVKFDDQFASRL